MTGVQFPAEATNNVQTISGANPKSYPMGTGALSLGAKRQRREAADRSPASIANVTAGATNSPLSSICLQQLSTEVT
jgi:hypothetical protein